MAILTLGLGGLFLWATTKTIKEGELCVRRTRDGRAVILPPGRHSNLPGESYGHVQSVAQEVIDLGPRRLVTIRDGFRGESYKNGKLVVLFPGRHLLEATHSFVKSVSMDLDEVDLGPKKIVTIKNGWCGVAYDKGVLQILKEGRHELTLPDQRFAKFLSLQQEVVELPELQVKTTDNIQVIVHAVLNYKIIDPVKAVTNVEHLSKSLYELAEVTLSAILRRNSFRDLSPAANTDWETSDVSSSLIPSPMPSISDKGKRIHGSSHHASKVHALMHDTFQRDFAEIVHEWGVELIGGVQLKTIEPKDARLQTAIAESSVQTARADSNRRQAEFEREVQVTRAKGTVDVIKRELFMPSEERLSRTRGRGRERGPAHCS